MAQRRWTAEVGAGAAARAVLGSAPMVRVFGLAAGMITLASATPAFADPCEAPLPPNGTAFSGIVRYVGDGDSLCVGPAGRPDLWVEIRLADFYAPKLHEPGGQRAKALLVSIAAGKRLDCRAGRRSYDCVVAWCEIDGKPIGDLLRARGGAEGGKGSRRAP